VVCKDRSQHEGDCQTVDGEVSAQQVRSRALIVPREHGAWGLLLVPLLAGAIVGLNSLQRVFPTLLFAVAALLLFWLRTPVESLVGSGPMVARTNEERRVAFFGAIVLAVISAACLIALLWGGRNWKLLPIGAVAAFAFIAQTVLRNLGRGTRLASQVIGALGLTATAPAAYYVASGHVDARAAVLWAANWFFAANQIHFVQLRLHAFRAQTFREKVLKGKLFLIGQISLLAALVVGAFAHLVPLLVVLAFAPALFRGTRWFFQAPDALDVRSLGWSEMRQGVAFGVLLTVALLVH
jgi:hypothetical protein